MFTLITLIFRLQMKCIVDPVKKSYAVFSLNKGIAKDASGDSLKILEFVIGKFFKN